MDALYVIPLNVQTKSPVIFGECRRMKLLNLS